MMPPPISPCRCFNSRSRVGSDVLVICFGVMAGCFNSRSRVGSDADNAQIDIFKQQFQFALPRGERPVPGSGKTLYTVFQFALPRGERHTS